MLLLSLSTDQDNWSYASKELIVFIEHSVSCAELCALPPTGS
jgi:hypothetical protein